MNFSRKKAVSPIIASLLLIAIAVAAGIIVYVYVNSLAGGLTGGGGNQETQQIQMQAYSFSSTTGSGQVLEVYLENVGSSTVTISSIYFDGTQLTEWGTTGTPVAYEPDLTVPTTQGSTANGCFALVTASTTISEAVTGTPSASGSATACTGAATGACTATAFCIVPSASLNEVGLSTSSTPGLAAQTSAALIIGLNGHSCGGSPPACPATSGTSHTIKIVTATGGTAVFTVVAGRTG